MTLKEDISLGNLKLNFSTTKFSVGNLERMYDFTFSLDVSGTKQETKTNFLGFTATKGSAPGKFNNDEFSTYRLEQDEEVGRIGVEALPGTEVFRLVLLRLEHE